MATVLLVDNTPTIREVVIDCFLRNHIVIQAVNGRDGKKRFETSTMPIDIVITDFSMPLMNGLELACWIKKHHPKIPVILMSGDEKKL